MSETSTLDTESGILEQVIEPDTAGMSPEAAHALLRFQFNAAAVARMNELAEKNRQGTIAPSERALLERYVRVGNFFAAAALQPAAGEPCAPEPRDNVGAAAHEIPDQTAAVVLDHQRHGPLVDAEVVWRHPPAGR